MEEEFEDGFRVDYGIWGFPLSLFRVITLTNGEDNIIAQRGLLRGKGGGNVLVRGGKGQDFDLVRS